MTDVYPVGTIEYVPLSITRNAVTVTGGLETSVVPNGQGPGTWTATTLVDAQPCFLLSGFAAGIYRVWVRATYGGEQAILNCGTLTVAGP